MKTFANVLIVLGLIMFLYFGIQFLFLILVSIFFFFYDIYEKIFENNESKESKLTYWEQYPELGLEYYKDVLSLKYLINEPIEEINKIQSKIKKLETFIENKNRIRRNKIFKIIIVFLITVTGFYLI